MMTVKLINTSKHPAPAYATVGAAGLDLRANLEVPLSVAPLERVLIPTGLFMEIPFGYEGQVRPRSGLALKHGITRLTRTIEVSYVFCWLTFPLKPL